MLADQTSNAVRAEIPSIHFDFPLLAIRANKRLATRSLNRLIDLDGANHRPDVVHATQCASIMMLTAACRLTRTPLVVSLHTDLRQITSRDREFVQAHTYSALSEISS